MRGERRQSQEPRVEPQTTKSFGFYCWPGTGTIATASSNLSPPLFPTVRGWKSDGTQEQHPHCRPPTPPHEHEHSTDRSARARRRRWWTENAYQLAARRRRRRHSGGLDWKNGRGDGEEPREQRTGRRPRRNPSRARALLFSSFSLCTRTNSLSLSRPGSSNKSGNPRLRLDTGSWWWCLCAIASPHPLLH